MKKFKKGEVVKAFVQLGVQTKKSWTKMNYLRRSGGKYVVQYYDGQERTVRFDDIRRWTPIEDHDAAIAKFDESFPELLAFVQRAAKELLPEKWQGIKVDEGEKSITMTAAGVSVQAAIVEIERHSLRGVELLEVPSWNITSVHDIPATRDSPPDCDIVDEGHNTTTWGAAAMLISKTYEFNATRFWEGVGEELMFKEMEEMEEIIGGNQ